MSAIKNSLSKYLLSKQMVTKQKISQQKISKDMFSIILVEPEHASNVGAVARVMANFHFQKLFLINPKCDYLGKDAILRAKRDALNILKNAKKISFKNLSKFDYLIGTSAVVGTDYNITRVPVFPDELSTFVSGKNIALIFGREGIGLRNTEIELCNLLVHIPTDGKYKAMNLSHAVAIILYELSKEESKKELQKVYPLPLKNEMNALTKLISRAIKKNIPPTADKQKTQEKVWKKLLGRSKITKRELFALCGFFRAVGKKKEEVVKKS